jgi:hypothetical protein
MENEIDNEQYKYGFNYGIICNLIKNINTKFEIYKDNSPISQDKYFIEGFRLGVKENLNLESIEEFFIVKPTSKSIFINFEGESEKIRNLYSIFLLAVLSGFNMTIPSLIFWFAMLLLFTIVCINRNIINKIIDLLHQHNYNKLISYDINEIKNLKYYKDIDIDKIEYSNIHDMQLYINTLPINERFQQDMELKIITKIKDNKIRGEKMFRSLDDFKASPIGLLKILMFIMLILIVFNYNHVNYYSIQYNAILVITCIMIFCELLIDAQKIIIRLNKRNFNLWQCFFPLEVDPKIDTIFIKSLAKHFWIRLELFTHIWNCLSLLLISLYGIFIGSEYGFFVTPKFFWVSWIFVFYDIIITSLIELKFSKTIIHMKHPIEKTSTVEYIFMIGRFIELSFAGILIWFLLNNRYLIDLDNDICNYNCRSRCTELVISLCIITSLQGLTVPIVFSETLTLFFLNVFSLLFLFGFAIDFISRIFYLSIIWSVRSFYKAIKLCINN